MTGAYAGPYPTQVQTTTALQNAQTISVSALINDTISLNGKNYTLDPGVGQGIISDSAWNVLADVISVEQLKKVYGDRIKATLIKKTCLIVQIPAGVGSNNTNDSSIVLLDAVSGRPFAYYAVGSPGLIPQVSWYR